MWRRTWLVAGLLLLTFLPAYANDTKNDLEIVATTDEVAGAWKVSGRIIRGTNSAALQDIVVWVNASTSSGNHASFFAPPLSPQGEFEVSSIPKNIRSDRVVQLTVVARTSAGLRIEKSALTGHTSILAPLGLSVGVVTFLGSLVLPFWKSEPGQTRYLLSLVLACLFTGMMIACLAMGLKRVNTPGWQDDITPIPFGSVYRGTYDKNVSADWLFSMTSPPDQAAADGAPQPPRVDKGFGAPLWVLLMSALGCGVLTISLIVGEIGNNPGNDPIEIRHRIQKVVRHQFFMLFAPWGAILVYQILVAAQAVTNPFTVAIAAVGSGMTLNSLLNEAIRRAGRIIEGSRRSDKGSDTVHERAGHVAASPAIIAK